MYRPTIRYDDVFKTYVDDVFKTTSMDRNQIIRAALFVAAHTPEFRALLHNYRVTEQNIPVPSWTMKDDYYWKGQATKGECTDDSRQQEFTPLCEDTGRIEHSGSNGRPNVDTTVRTSTGRVGEVSTERIPVTNGAIIFTAN